MRAVEAQHTAFARTLDVRSRERRSRPVTARALVFVATAAIAAVAAGISCAPTTRVVADWKAPNVGSLVIQRPLVVFQHSSEAMRRSVEDALASRIPGSTPSYQVLTTDEIQDVERAKAKVKSAGFDTVILTRLTEIKKDIDVIPGTLTSGPLWGAWDPMWSDVYSPAYLSETTIVTLETMLYTLDPSFGTGEGELVWASRTETFDPKNVSDSVVTAAIKAMEEDGFVIAGTQPERKPDSLW